MRLRSCRSTLSLQAFGNVARPEFGEKWRLRFQIQLLFRVSASDDFHHGDTEHASSEFFVIKTLNLGALRASAVRGIRFISIKPKTRRKRRNTMNAKHRYRGRLMWLLALLGAALIATQWTQPPSAYAAAAGQLQGQVLGGGAPIANSTVTLWAASAGAPRQLAQTRTGADGRFALNAAGGPGKDAILYLVAKGGRPTASKAGGRTRPSRC